MYYKQYVNENKFIKNIQLCFKSKDRLFTRQSEFYFFVFDKQIIFQCNKIQYWKITCLYTFSRKNLSVFLCFSIDYYLRKLRFSRSISLTLLRTCIS